MPPMDHKHPPRGGDMGVDVMSHSFMNRILANPSLDLETMAGMHDSMGGIRDLPLMPVIPPGSPGHSNTSKKKAGSSVSGNKSLSFEATKTKLRRPYRFCSRCWIQKSEWILRSITLPSGQSMNLNNHTNDTCPAWPEVPSVCRVVACTTLAGSLVGAAGRYPHHGAESCLCGCVQVLPEALRATQCRIRGRLACMLDLVITSLTRAAMFAGVRTAGPDHDSGGPFAVPAELSSHLGEFFYTAYVGNQASSAHGPITKI